MKSWLFVLGSAIGIAAIGGGVNLTAQHDAGLTPTFNKDIAPIVFNNCANCHRPGQVAPMSLTSYRQVRPWARAIKAKVVEGTMPPWYADPRYGEFVNDRSLAPEQVKMITAWVDGGAPEGGAPLTAVMPDFEDSWTHPSGRPPDIVISMAEAFMVPAEGELPGFTIYQDLPAELKTKAHFVEAIQLLPGTLSVVHHMSFGVAPLEPGKKLGPGEAWPGGPIVQGALIDVESGESVSVGDVNEESVSGGGGSEMRFCCYVPGGTFQKYPGGAGKRIDPNGVIAWGMHYTAAGKAMEDVSRVGLWFKNDEMDYEIKFSGSNEQIHHIVRGNELIDSDFTPVKGRGHSAVPAIPVIPPHTKEFAITGIRGIQDDTTVYVMWPHMHLRGKEMTILVTYPDGREEVLISAPNYDFNWQIFYEPKEPIKLPAGSTVKTIGSMDNSVANRWNPAPDKEVYWSEQSWDEMFIGVFEISVDKDKVGVEKTTSTAKPPTTAGSQ